MTSSRLGVGIIGSGFNVQQRREVVDHQEDR